MAKKFVPFESDGEWYVIPEEMVKPLKKGDTSAVFSWGPAYRTKALALRACDPNQGGKKKIGDDAEMHRRKWGK